MAAGAGLAGSGVTAAGLALFLPTVALAILTPGPAIIACAQCAVARGRAQALPFALGLAFGASLWCLASLAGLGVLLRAEPRLYLLLRIAGGAYLLWVAFQMARAAGRPPAMVDAGTAAAAAPGFWRGVALNLSNPKPALFYAALILSVFPALRGAAGAGVVYAAALGCELVFYSLVALLMSRPAVQRGYRRAQAGIDRGAAALIGALGLLLILRS